jgi:hypothetical protein
MVFAPQNTRAKVKKYSHAKLITPEVNFNSKEERTIMWTILALLIVLWLLGFFGGVGGSLIHLLLVIAAVILILQLITGRRAVI